MREADLSSNAGPAIFYGGPINGEVRVVERIWDYRIPVSPTLGINTDQYYAAGDEPPMPEIDIYHYELQRFFNSDGQAIYLCYKKEERF